MPEISGHVRQRVWTGPDGEERSSWEFVVQLATVAGKRQRKTHGGFRTQKQALAALRRELTARESGVHAERTGVSFADFITDRWLPWVEQNRRPSTYANYKRDADLHVLPALGSLPLQQVRPLDVESLYLYLARPQDGRRPLGNRSLHNVATVVHGSLKQAVRWELIARNPATNIVPPVKMESVDDALAGCGTKPG